MATSKTEPIGVAGVGEDRHQPEPEHKQSGEGSPKPPIFKPKGSSITLVGAGRRDGSDVNNSLSLTDFYKYMLEKKP